MDALPDSLDSPAPALSLEPATPSQAPRCGCRACIQARGDTIGGLPRTMCEMIVCPQCSNKRCPHATDHRHPCTDSNEPGQPGSIYEAVEVRGTWVS